VQKDRPTLAASSFAIVADLRPASPLIVLMTPVCASELVSGEDYSRYHQRVAVLFDEDEDERVIDVLTAILYRAPTVFQKIAAVAEHKGLMTIWTRNTSDADRALLYRAADPVATRGDHWSVVVREMLWNPRTLRLEVSEYSEGSRSVAPPPEADQRDRLLKALHEVLPLGGLGSIDWCGPGASGMQLVRMIENLQQEITRESAVHAVGAAGRKRRESTLTLKRSRGSCD
jgi:hypothetical protein